MEEIVVVSLGNLQFSDNLATEDLQVKELKPKRSEAIRP